MNMKIVKTFLLLSLLSPAIHAQESARDIIQKSDDLMRGKTHTGKYTMTIIRPDWQRSTEFKFWSEGSDKAFILILAPAKDKGVTFLKIKREMWNYIPKINRDIKIPPSMMLQSWMGSDLTNDDLVQESNAVTDYSHALLGEERVAGYEAYKIELKPKPEAAVVWDKIVMWIAMENYFPLKEEYYNERGELIRTMLFSDIKKMGDRIIPAKFEVVEEKKPGHKTVMELEDVTFDRPFKKSVFTRQNLRRAKP
jgi:outer membrane lipoprotein-sorting protein